MKSITVRVIDNGRTDELVFEGVECHEMASIMPMIYSFVNNENVEIKEPTKTTNITDKVSDSNSEKFIGKFMTSKPKKEYVDIKNYNKTQLVYTECEGCDDKIIAKVEENTTKLVCRKCNTTNDISTESTVAHFHCLCGTKLRIPRVHRAGDTIHAKCPKCKEKLEAQLDESTSEYVGY